jgi:hypothetical protein
MAAAVSTERTWESLSLEEKLIEMGFTQGTHDARLHAALDQLLDAGALLGEIEAMMKPIAEGVVGSDIPGEMQATCKHIYELIAEE